MPGASWSKEELGLLVSYAEMGYCVRKITEELRKCGFDRTHNSVSLQEQRLKSAGMIKVPDVDRIRHLEEDREERKKFSDKLKDRAKVDVVIEAIQACLKKVSPKSSLYLKRGKTETDPETMVLMLSDIHIGKLTRSYNSEVFKKQLSNLLNTLVRILSIQRNAYQIDDLVVFGLGDWVDGISIFPTHNWKVDNNVMNQIFAVGVPALSEFFTELARHFKSIKVYTVRGNHGRSGRFYPEELNFDLILYEVLSLTCGSLKNVEWVKTWDWYQVAEVQNHRFLLMHGDAIKMWMNIPIYGLVTKGMRWKGSIREKWDYMCHGHFHTTLDFPWNDFHILGTGTFVTDDDFSEQILGMKSSNRQKVFGVHPRRGITWKYDIDVGKDSSELAIKGHPDRRKK